MSDQPSSSGDLSIAEYQSLAEFRYQIRKFLHFSGQAARANHLESQQHQLLLAIKGLPPGQRPTIAELASRLLIQHHSAVELINRSCERGAVKKTHGSEDRREVIVTLTPVGEKLLSKLSVAHHEELETTGPELAKALKKLMASLQQRHKEVA